MEELARIFPLHLEMIKQEALVLDILFDENSVNEQAQRGLTYVQQGYQNHLCWLKDHEIFRSPSSLKFKISDLDLEGFHTILLGELALLNQG